MFSNYIAKNQELSALESLKGTSFIVLNVADGSLDKYANPTPNSNGKTAMPSTDSNTDIEVEFNAAGQAVFVTTGIHAGIDTVSKGCDNKGWVSNACSESIKTAYKINDKAW